MTIPATPAALKQVAELHTLAKEFRFYANGVKQVKNAKAMKSSFQALQDGILTVGKRVSPIEKKIGAHTKIIDALQKGAFKEINPKWGRFLTLFLDALQVGFTTFMVFKNDEILNLNIESMKATEKGVQDSFTRSINNSIQIKNIQERIKTQENDFKEEILKQEVQNNFFRKQFNDLTYEVREGRKKIEARVNEQINGFKKIQNDLTYEVREGRKKLEATVQNVIDKTNKELAKATQTVRELQNRLQTTQKDTEKRIQSIAADTNTRLKGVESQQAKLQSSLNGIEKNAISSVQGELSKLQKQINDQGFLSREIQAKINTEIAKALEKADVNTAKSLQLFKQELDKRITASEFDRDTIKRDIQKLLLDKNKSELLQQRFVDLEIANKKSADILNKLFADLERSTNKNIAGLEQRIAANEAKNQNISSAISSVQGELSKLQKQINDQGFLSREIQAKINTEIAKALEKADVNTAKSLQLFKQELDKRITASEFDRDTIKRDIQKLLLDKNKSELLQQRFVDLENANKKSADILNKLFADLNQSTNQNIAGLEKRIAANEAKNQNNFTAVNSNLAKLEKTREGDFTLITRINDRVAAVDKYSRDTRFLITRVDGRVTQILQNVNGRLERISQETFEKLRPQIKNETRHVVTPQLEPLRRADREIDARIKTTQSEIGEIERQLEKTIKPDIKKLDTRIKERERVDKEANNKLGQILGLVSLIPGIPAKAGNYVTQKIPTISQIEKATGTAMCKNLKTGCGKSAIDDAVGRISSNANQNAGNLLNALNTGANAAQLGLLNTINTKLGAQLPGGLAGTFGRLWQTLQVDRILNVLILISTFHNALMLSNNIAQTLFSVFDNIGQTIGFKWKNEKGEDVGFGGLVSEWTSNFFKTIFGEENYSSLVSTYKKANRIYQAGANLLSSITNMSDVILNSIEYLAGQSAKVANALRNFRVVGERAYEVFNPQPNLKWGIFNKLQKGQESADFLLQVSQIPIEITQAGAEFNESATELAKAIKEDPEVPSGTVKIEDAAQTKEKETKVKAASISLALSEIDLEADE